MNPTIIARSTVVCMGVLIAAGQLFGQPANRGTDVARLHQIAAERGNHFARERAVKRYNRQLNDLIEFWAFFLAGDGGDLRALAIGDGVDAAFRLASNTGFSRRAQV